MPILVDTANAYALGTTRSITFTGQAQGDLTLVFAGNSDDGTITIAETGWSTGFNHATGTGNDRAGAFWYKFFEVGDDTSPEITTTASDRVIVVGAVYRGVSAGFDDFDWNEASGSNPATPAITATVAPTLALSFKYCTESPAAISGIVAPSTDWDIIESRQVNDFGDHVAAIAVKALSTTGTETPAAWTLTGSLAVDTHYGVTLNMIPDADELEARTVPFEE